MNAVYVDSESVVVISNERYEELVRAETTLNILATIAEDETSYRTAEVVRTVLEPYMKPKAPEGGASDAE